MIFYNKDGEENVAYIRCSCGTHGIQLQKITFKDENIKPVNVLIVLRLVLMQK